MKKLTAIEWFNIELQKRFPKESFEMYNNNQLSYEDMILKANTMFEQQIIDACNQTDFFGDDSRLPGLEYYNKTFKIK